MTLSEPRLKTCESSFDGGSVDCHPHYVAAPPSSPRTQDSGHPPQPFLLATLVQVSRSTCNVRPTDSRCPQSRLDCIYCLINIAHCSGDGSTRSGAFVLISEQVMKCRIFGAQPLIPCSRLALFRCRSFLGPRSHVLCCKAESLHGPL